MQYAMSQARVSARMRNEGRGVPLNMSKATGRTSVLTQRQSEIPVTRNATLSRITRSAPTGTTTRRYGPSLRSKHKLYTLISIQFML